ncbi:uncharacterized protein MONBRDRAFT_31214 [Monosiga brevicollis MX1]|uniref:Uncharacterized protein n=1 Tax=Monosiga brevicollis TaxID=81824 RepID=A9USE9_MONBE|nr:uncharacterized protein MONBRDRAFT_31214 [Monosiga brevicollis MX1]EDQ92090.1 predicted protein [Monosiga brevicollis MX1]|eukprot:XP_001743376.1 hypothetical protein [Monosiga brevicollis MX1]
MKARPWSTSEKEFVLNALDSADEDEPARLDGRHRHEHRECKFTFHQTPGFVELALGKTRVMAQLTCEVVAPHPDYDSEGFFRFNVSIAAGAGIAYAAQRSSSEEIVELTRLLERAFKEARAIDSESLCIVKGEKVWEVRVDVTVLENGGNMADGVCLAALAGILTFRRPYVSLTGGQVKIHSLEEHEPVSLSVHHRPIAVTIASIAGGRHLLVDPTSLEEAVAEGCITVCLNGHGEICSINSGGGTPLSPEQMKELLQLAKRKHAVFNHTLEQAMRDAGHVFEVDSILQAKQDGVQGSAADYMDTAADDVPHTGGPRSARVEEPGAALLA